MTIERALPRYNYQDYEQWEGDWELIQGVPFAMTPSPTLDHQRISQKIAVQLESSLSDCKQCEALFAIDWKIDEHTVVEPDNLVTCHKEQGKYLTMAPNLIVEILSPSTQDRDRQIKFELYQREGVLYYCLVDPTERMTKIFKLHQGRYIKDADVSSETHNFDLKQCRIAFDFSLIWPDQI